MVCLAITRGGWGDVYQFDSRADADSHPVVQYGDAILAGPECVTRQYNTLEIGRLLEMIGNEDLRVSVLSSIHPDLALPDRVRLERIAERAESIWDALLARALTVPSDPTEVLDRVRRDRELMITNKDTNMTDNKATDNKGTETKGAEVKTKTKAPAAPRAPKFADASVIRLLADKEGKKYGKDNNPKRAGTTTFDRFAKLVDGMTVAAYVKAVGNQASAFSELDYNAKKGFLVVEEAGI